MEEENKKVILVTPTGEGGVIKTVQVLCVKQFTGKLVPAPGLEGVAGSLIEVSLHGDPISCVSIEIHDGVVVGDILEIF